MTRLTVETRCAGCGNYVTNLPCWNCGASTIRIVLADLYAVLKKLPPDQLESLRRWLETQPKGE